MMEDIESKGRPKEKLLKDGEISSGGFKLKDPSLIVEEEEVSTKATRFSAFLRSLYGELMGTWLLFLTIYGFNANASLKGWNSEFVTLVNAVGAGFQVTSLIFCFSSLSGAQFNPAITFALWLVGKVSNRKCIFFILIQLLASVLAMACLYVMFPDVSHDMLKACAVIGPSNASAANIFFTEFLLTFFLTFVCFALAFEEAEFIKPSKMAVQTIDDGESVIMYSSTPQSKAGFAPFAIGFTIVALVFIGGGSGVGMNPARTFGPQLFANEWNNWYLLYLGQMSGAGLGALMVTFGPQSSKRQIARKTEANVLPPQMARRFTDAGLKDSLRGTEMSSTVKDDEFV